MSISISFFARFVSGKKNGPKKKSILKREDSNQIILIKMQIYTSTNREKIYVES